jgi:hypothetical protein
MLNREINVPKALHELHGEKSRLSSILLVYLTAFVVAGIALSQMIPLGLPFWKLILAVVVFLDIGGGVTANLSSSTNQYYQKKAALRPIFLAMHIIHPLVLWLVFPQSAAFLAFVMIFTLGSAFAVNRIKDRELQQNCAAGLTAIGLCLALLFPLSFSFLYAFAPLFMVKLILGFSVKRPNFIGPHNL